MTTSSGAADHALRGRRPSRAAAALRASQRRYAVGAHALTGVGFVVACVQLARGQVTAVDVALLVVFYSIAVQGVTVGFHRLFTHRAFDAGPRTRALLAIAGSTAAEGPVVYWVALHRKHHQTSDTPDDPHSPNGLGSSLAGTLRGLAHAQLGWALDGEVVNTGAYAKDLLRDPTIAWVNRLFPLWVVAGWLAPALVGGLAARSLDGAWHGLIWGGLARTFLVLHATSAVNSICHRFGRRPFATSEHSANVALLAIPTFGEAWHNNHHAFPRSAMLGLAWWQIDLGAWLVRSLAACGLARGVQCPDAASIAMRRRTGGVDDATT